VPPHTGRPSRSTRRIRRIPDVRNSSHTTGKACHRRQFGGGIQPGSVGRTCSTRSCGSASSAPVTNFSVPVRD
jgi:hypothetical protein